MKSSKLIPIHLIVARTFVPNDDRAIKTTVNHIDGNTSNYHASNLEWMSQADNNRHALVNGLRGKTAQGTAVRRIDPAGNEPAKYYSSIASAAKDVGLHRAGTGIQAVLDNPSRTAAGYHWETARVKLVEDTQPLIEWRALKQCDGIELSITYEISANGDVRNKVSGRELRPSTNHEGYRVVYLSDGHHRSRRFFVHRLVASVFCPLPDGAECSRHLDVDHIDSNRTNNVPANLQYLGRGAHCRKTRGRPVAMKDSVTGQILAIYPTIAAAAKAAHICESGVRIGLKRGSPRWAWVETTITPAPPTIDSGMDQFIDELLASIVV